METIREAVDQERPPIEHDRPSARIAQAQAEIAFLRRRLERLATLQSLLKQKYQTRLSSLSQQASDIEGQQWELRTMASQLKDNRDRQSSIREEIDSLERRKKTINEAIRQTERYRKSSNVQVRVIEEEHEILSQRIHDLEHMLELLEKADLDKKELDIVSQRMGVTKELLEEHASDLSKRTIDLLFEFYVPPRNNRRFRF